jgi:hypothetical protein
MNEACGADETFAALGKGQAAKIEWRDAITIGVTRLFRIRGWRHYAHVVDGGVSPKAIRRSAIKALIAVSACTREYLMRPADEDIQEARRVHSLTGEFGPGGERGPVHLVLDGLGVRVEYPRPPGTHRQVHNQYAYAAMAQMTIGIDQSFDLAAMTDFYSGADGESTYVIASKILDRYEDDDGDWWHLVDGAWVMTDKGYRLLEHLRPMGCFQVKPTEMFAGVMAGSESARSRRVSQPRSASERMVYQFKRFDIFDGQPVAMSEWPFLQFYKDVVGSLIKFQGPLPDRSRDESVRHLPPPPLLGRALLGNPKGPRMEAGVGARIPRSGGKEEPAGSFVVSPRPPLNPAGAFLVLQAPHNCCGLAVQRNHRCDTCDCSCAPTVDPAAPHRLLRQGLHLGDSLGAAVDPVRPGRGRASR